MTNSQLVYFCKRLRHYHSNIRPIKIFNGNAKWNRDIRKISWGDIRFKTYVQGTNFLAPA